MPDADPARPVPAAGSGSELALRVGSALVLVPLAIGTAYLGGWVFAVFWGAAAIVVTWEWTLLVSGGDRRAVLIIGIVAVTLAVALAASTAGAVGDSLREIRLVVALVVLAMGMLAAAIIAPRNQAFWVAAGIPYAGAMGLAPIVLRADVEFGFVALILLFAVVWATDIGAYFFGRALGGPKLAPRLSPKKTWSGAIGGIVCATIAAVLVVQVARVGSVIAATLVAIVLSVLAQAGDLFESALKRRFGVKDSGFLIPGHGGLMDRLDGFVAAAVLACVIGLARGGMDSPARGLLMW